MSEERESSKDLFVALATLIGSRGKERLELMAQSSKKKLALRSLRKDRSKMYEKLGREVEQLCAAGEVHHGHAHEGSHTRAPRARHGRRRWQAERRRRWL